MAEEKPIDDCRGEDGFDEFADTVELDELDVMATAEFKQLLDLEGETEDGSEQAAKRSTG